MESARTLSFKTIKDYATKPDQGGALFKKFRDQIMGVVPIHDPGPGKATQTSVKLDTTKNKPRKGKTLSLVPPSKGRNHRSVLGVVSPGVRDTRTDENVIKRVDSSHPLE